MADTINTGGYDSPITYKNKAVTNSVILIKDSQCNLLGWRITNPNSTTAYFKFFNASKHHNLIRKWQTK